MQVEQVEAHNSTVPRQSQKIMFEKNDREEESCFIDLYQALQSKSMVV
jgi:hypothetical protein